MFLKLKRFYCFSNNYNIHKNYYQILGVTTAAPADDIKRAYKLLAKQYHPDVNKGKEEQFKNINEAYQVLSDSHLRSQYDSARISPHMNQNSSRTQTARPNGGRRWDGIGPRERDILEMLRRQQQQSLRQYHQSQRRKYYSQTRAYEQAMQDEYIRKYNQRMQQRHPSYQPHPGCRQQNNNFYNDKFDRSKDSIFKAIGENVRGLWQAWKEIKRRR